MAFTLDRNEAAERLGVSTRTVDRHIQANRIRTRRIGKKTFLEEDDVALLLSEMMGNTSAKNHTQADDYIVILDDEKPSSSAEILPSRLDKNQDLSTDAKMALAEFSRIYTDAQGVIAKKDEVIKDLSYKLGKVETELENSVNAHEYRRTANLLETIKTEKEVAEKNLHTKISTLEKEVQNKNHSIALMMVLFVLIIVAFSVYFFINRF